VGRKVTGTTKHRVHTPVSLRKALRCGFTILLCSCLLFGAAHCRAQESQDRAEAARQEQAKTQKHVYTEDDLARAKILTREDAARFAASRKETGPGEQAPLDASVDLPQLPLGDIALRYRDAKRAMQAQKPFHLPFEEPSFASPVISVAKPAPPRPGFSPAHPNLMPAHPNVVLAPAISSPAPLHRVDPFTRRSAPPVPSVTRIAPAAPAAQPFFSRPAPAPVGAQPNLSTKIAAQPSAVANTFSPLHTVTVQPGDSLWKLAQQTLGRGSRWRELLAANPGIVDPTRLAAGTHIIVPTATTTLQHVKSDMTVAVQQGDTLTKIAQSQYGRAASWTCIAQANPKIVDPNRIYQGQQLLLPFSCKP
jgi:nucleoid-associated protein YgaU